MGIELNRTVASIQVGHRHRTDLGDIDALARSIDERGLLQPMTITLDGVLVCGRRRLEAIRRLGWKTTSVWVRSDVSDRLGHLLAEQDDNAEHKPLTQIEAASLYRELTELMRENAARRKQATQFTSEHQPGADGARKFRTPSDQAGRVSRQAAAMIPGGASDRTLDKIDYVTQAATRTDLPANVREQLAGEVATLESGGAVEPVYARVRALLDEDREQRQADLHALADEAVARVTATKTKKKAPARQATPPAGAVGKWPVRAFVLTWRELESWWTHYDIDELAAELTLEQAEAFFTTAAGTIAFADRLRAVLEHNDTEDASDDAATGSGERDADEPGDERGRPLLRAL
ncbi:ParB N-terminal domain-containing protein [Brevibacterium sp. XM4083]|uniref:ParB N-terminal domain-containing protein n=1 Tax=Brevibacterium sp. XM4083 TaxID=2583238 RepID=UPI00112D00E8|nr:ParB N-terminal domain-containing protein [Brevibacterium sp. XM4083]MCM1014402.1 ParB N-terminal domain-containing protein [Brevibacterium sp. XM4083]